MAAMLEVSRPDEEVLKQPRSRRISMIEIEAMLSNMVRNGTTLQPSKSISSIIKCVRSTLLAVAPLRNGNPVLLDLTIPRSA